MNETLMQIDSNIEDLKKLLELARTQLKQLQETLYRINSFQLETNVTKATTSPDHSDSRRRRGLQ